MIGFTLHRPILSVLGATPEMMAPATAYFKIVFGGAFTLIFMFLASFILRGAGEAKTAMYIMIIATIVNIVLDPLLIFGIWIFPRLEVRGAAYATVIGQGFAMVLGLWVLFRGHTRIQIRFSDIRINYSIMKKLIFIAIPGTFQSGLRSFAYLGMIKIVSIYGTFAMAAFGIGIRVSFLVMMVGWAIGNSVSTLVGQNLGAMKPDRAEKSTWLGVAAFCSITVVFGIGFNVFSDPLIRIFNDHPDVVRLGSAFVKIQALSYPFLGLSMICAMGFNGAGDSRTPAIIIGLTFVALMIPLALFLPNIITPGTSGIWWAMTIAIMIQGVLMAMIFKRGKWKHQSI